MPPRGYPSPGGAGFPGAAAYGRGRGGQQDPYRQQQLLRVALVLLQQIATMERKPPVTLLLCLGASWCQAGGGGRRAGGACYAELRQQAARPLSLRRNRTLTSGALPAPPAAQ